MCSRVSYHLLQVLQAHPAMKSVIVREVRALIFRLPASTAAQAAPAVEGGEVPLKKNTHIRFADDATASSAGKSQTQKQEQKRQHNQKQKGKEHEKEKEGLARWNSHAWYYASVTLNQVVLTPTPGDRAVARTLVDVYFEMFEEILGSKREDDDDGEDDGEQAREEKRKGKGKGKASPAQLKGTQQNRKQKQNQKQKAKEVKGAAGFAEVEDSSSRLIGAILTGVNRALPFAQMHLHEESSAM